MMTPLLILIAVTAASIGYLLAKPYLKARKRDQIASQPFPKAWREVLKTNLPYFYKMPADLQLQLKRFRRAANYRRNSRDYRGTGLPVTVE